MSVLITKLSRKRLKLNSRKISAALKKEKTKALTMFIFSLFTISFFGFFAIRPTIKTIVQLRRQIEDRRELDKRLTEKIDQLVAAQAEYEFISPFIPNIARALPEKPRYTDTLYDIENIRVNSEATISSVKIDEVVLGSKKPGALQIELDAQGGFIPLEGLLNKVLANKRLMTISTLLLSQLEDEDKKSLILSGSIEMPYMKIEAESAEVNITSILK